MPKPDDIETRFRTAGHFTEALKKNLFASFCQPIVSVESAKVDYKYMEIFVRFREEEDKLLPPGTFFPILEANHLTPLLDRWVVREVLRWSADKQSTQPNWHIPRFNLNLADDTIRDKDFGGQVRDQLKETKIPSNRLWFEMTSQKMARLPDAARQTITRLKSLGCAIAVSDFSSVEMIARGYKEAGAQIVKLSGSVVRNIHSIFFSSRRRHTRLQGDWSSDVCSSDLGMPPECIETVSAARFHGSWAPDGWAGICVASPRGADGNCSVTSDGSFRGVSIRRS